MNLLRNLSIQRKLVWLMTLTSALALLLLRHFSDLRVALARETVADLKTRPRSLYNAAGLTLTMRRARQLCTRQAPYRRRVYPREDGNALAAYVRAVRSGSSGDGPDRLTALSPPLGPFSPHLVQANRRASLPERFQPIYAR